MTDAARVIGPFLIQYPLYAGLMGVMAASGLGAMLVEQFVSISGTVGIGEMSDLGHSPVKPDVELMEHGLRKALLDVDPFDPTVIDSIVDRYPSPLGAGIDIAAHDLRARHLGVPVHDLYGGAYRDRYKICYPIFRQFDESEIDPNIDRVRRMLALGFDLFRVYVGGNLDVDERFFHKLRDTFGDKVKIKSLDFSRRLDWKSCVAAIGRLEWCGVSRSKDVGIDTTVQDNHLVA